MDRMIGRGKAPRHNLTALEAGWLIYKATCDVPLAVPRPPPAVAHRRQRNMTGTEEKPQLTPSPPAHAEEKKAKPGATWKEGETHVLPKNNLPVVFTGFMFCIFLAALDQVSPFLVPAEFPAIGLILT